MAYRNGDHYRPSKPHPPGRHAGKPPPSQKNGDNNMYRFGGPSRGRSDFSFRSRISQRDLLTHVPSSVETPVLSQNHIHEKFRDLENLTDSDEEPMSEDTDTGEHSRAKRRKLDTSDSGAEVKVKWSNPDPYTALPPAPESVHKKVDVVKLIRKARNDTAGHHSTVADEDDFISFDQIVDTDADVYTSMPQVNAPNHRKPDLFPPPHSDGQEPSQTRRKRKHDDFEGDGLLGDHNRTQFHENGKVLSAWQTIPGVSPTPWLKPCESHDSPMTALHKEVIDFYTWVRPKEYETAVREDLLDRLSRELKRWRPGGTLAAFGSYAAGLYLPTGDMDLVYNYGGGAAVHKAKNDVFNVARFLQYGGLARPGSVQSIAFAKVPIVKFVDDLTGIKIDLSFNNNTGIVANETFKKWQASFPAVTILVAVVKQFLMIRGLNDNSVGGLGGFATICMVTSLMQNLPTQKVHNLGELLVEFFNLYGNLLVVENVGIRMEPPAYINKKTHHQMSYEKPNRLVIIDPNKADNNITGGSSQFPRISHLFSRTHDVLHSRLDDFAKADKVGGNFSFLADIIGGNFTSYDAQRSALSAIYYDQRDTVPDVPPAPPKQPTDNKSGARLARLRSLFPEMAQKLAKYTSIGPNQALAVGGWSSKEAMQRDIGARELQMQKGKNARG